MNGAAYSFVVVTERNLAGDINATVKLGDVIVHMETSPRDAGPDAEREASERAINTVAAAIESLVFASRAHEDNAKLWFPGATRLVGDQPKQWVR